MDISKNAARYSRYLENFSLLSCHWRSAVCLAQITKIDSRGPCGYCIGKGDYMSITKTILLATVTILSCFTQSAQAKTFIATSVDSNGNEQTGPVGSLEGLGFGVAIGASWYPENNVVSTIVQNNVLRLSSGGRSDVGFWLETHAWIFSITTASVKKDGKDEQVTTQALGPFVGVQLGSDNKIVEALGLGIMYGVRIRPDSDQSINIGIGYSAHQISVLTDGLVLNQPLPLGITSATTRSKYVGAPMLITSFSF